MKLSQDHPAATQSLHLRHKKGRNTSSMLEGNSATALSGSNPQFDCVRHTYLPNQSLRKADQTRYTALLPWTGEDHTSGEVTGIVSLL